MGWYFGFKLHLIINDSGELIAIALTAANTDDRRPIREMTKDLFGKLFGDRGCGAWGIGDQNRRAPLRSARLKGRDRFGIDLHTIPP